LRGGRPNSPINEGHAGILSRKNFYALFSALNRIPPHNINPDATRADPRAVTLATPPRIFAAKVGCGGEGGNGCAEGAAEADPIGQTFG